MVDFCGELADATREVEPTREQLCEIRISTRSLLRMRGEVAADKAERSLTYPKGDGDCALVA